MSISKNLTATLASLGIAALCFGYFAAYIPYSMMTKMIIAVEIGAPSTAAPTAPMPASA